MRRKVVKINEFDKILNPVIIIPTGRYRMRVAQKYSPTKEKMLNVAYDLMLAKGYVATTVDEICEKAEVTKGSFFHYFESKEALARALLERACASKKEMLKSIENEMDPLKRVYAYIDFLIKMSKGPEASKGCLLGTFAQELSDTHPEIREICNEGFNQMAQKLSQDLDEAKAKYAPKATFEGKSLAKHYIAVLEGSLILAKAQKDPKNVEESLQHFKQYLKSLFKA